jgi:hypothetical protein
MSADRPITVDPKIDQDPNYIAYKEQEESLKTNHMGEWVAFVGGQLVASEKNQEELFKNLHKNYAQTGAFVHQIVEVEKVIHLGGPRLFLD